MCGNFIKSKGLSLIHISYKIPTLLSVFTSIFNQAWGYSAIKEEGTKDEQNYNNKILQALIAFTMIAAIGLITITKPFLNIYVSAEYYKAWKYVPFLVIGSVYLTFGTFMSSSYVVHKDSFGFLFSGTFGAVINIVLNFILIPHIGTMGAAIATCLSLSLIHILKKMVDFRMQEMQQFHWQRESISVL